MSTINPSASLLTEAQVAKRLAVKTRTLQGWRQRGVGPAFLKLGACVRYPEDGVNSWIAQQVRRSTSDPGPLAA
jgi:predicted DNA-binding transcriptional regulator AlpA